jgi:vancomycin resistance protein YoaR
MRLWPRRKVYLDNLPKTHDIRFMLIFVVGLAVVFGSLYAVGYVVAGDKLPNGTRVAEVDVGGMTPAEAEQSLENELDPRLDQTIKARVSGKTYEIEPRLAGMSFDFESTIAEATGGSPWDPRHMLHVLMGGGDLEPTVDIEDAKLAGALKQIDKHVSQEPVESTVSFRKGVPKVDYGQAGRRHDYQKSGDRLAAALIEGDRKVELAVEDVQPRVTAIKATKFVHKVGRRAVSGPIKIKVADSSVTLAPQQFGPALTAVPDGNGLRLDVDQGQLMKRSRGSLAKLPHHPVNARIEFSHDHPRIVPGTSGVTVAPDQLAKAVLEAADKRGGDRVARAEATPDNPKVTTEDVKMMRIHERVASVTVRYRVGPGEPDPARALNALDGTLMAPGRTLSYLHAVPEPGSPAGALVAGMAYRAGFFAGLDIPQHTPARVYSQVLPPGFDAHIEAPATDLVMANSSPFGVYIRAFVESPGGSSSRARTAHVEVWSSPYWKVKSHSSDRYNTVKPQVIKNPDKNCTARPGIAGFDVDVTRLLTREGHKRSERSHATYAVQDQIRCVPNRRGR